LRRVIYKYFVLIAGWLTAFSAIAVPAYEVQLYSAVGQPLRGEVRFQETVSAVTVLEAQGGEVQARAEGTRVHLSSDAVIRDPNLNVTLSVRQANRTITVPLELLLPLVVPTQVTVADDAQSTISPLKYQLLEQRLTNLRTRLQEKEETLGWYYYLFLGMALIVLLGLWGAVKYKQSLDNKARQFTVEDSNQNEDYLFDIVRIYLEDERREDAQVLLRHLASSPEPVIRNRAREQLEALESPPS
jgi:hypothetical protein